jgi:DNA-binding MarR family transcriptional regulator
VRTTPPIPSIGDDRAALTTSIISQFRSALRELRCMSGDRTRRRSISFTHIHILSMLDRHGDMPMSRLADMLDVSLSNASGLIDRLEDRGLVERQRAADDRRVVLVRVTEPGRTALAEGEVFKDELMQSILARLDDRRLARLAAALEDVRDSAVAVFASDPELGRHEHVHEPVRDRAAEPDGATPHEPAPVSSSLA